MASEQSISKTKTADTADAETELGKSLTVDDSILIAQGHVPVLQRTFDIFGTLGFGFSISNSWLSYASCFGQSMLYGGPQATVFGLLLACAAQWIIALGLSEQASAFPSSGGQYHFTYILANEKHRRFAAFAVGALSIFGWLVMTCSGLSNNVQSIIGILVFIQPDFTPQKWHSYLMYLGLVVTSMVPVFAIPHRHFGKWTQMCLILSVAGFLVVTITILAMCKDFNDASFILKFDGVSGWPKGVAWLMTVGNAMYAFPGIDGVIHVAEEMHQPGKAIPRAINGTMAIGLLTVLPYTLAMMFVIKDLDAVRSSRLPSLEVFYQATGSHSAALGLQGLLVVLYYTCMPSQWITCGRLIWAFARDNGMPVPQYWCKVSSRFGYPVRPIILSAIFCSIYGLLYMASTQAFNSIITTAVLGINISFAVPQGLTIFGGRRNMLPFRPFNLGKFGILCNVWSPLWVIIIGVFICFPNQLPVTFGSMNYVCVVLAILGVLMFGCWFAVRGKFDGPTIDWAALNMENEREL